MKKLSKTYAAILALCLVEVILFFSNFHPGTFLVGWDNVYPELNFLHNFQVNIAGVWQEYRGLGVQDTMSHTANLLHTLYVALLSTILPLSVTRYAYHFLMHLIGGLGMYFLLRKQFKKSSLVSVLGAFFYQYNIGTIQMFYAPFEAFSMHFAALPWLIISNLRFLHNPNRKNTLLLIFISLVTTPQSLIPTLFIAYSIVLASMILIHVLYKQKSGIQSSLLLVVLTFIINAFWLLPFIHGALYQGKTVANTKINQLSSQVIFERNNKRGTVLDVLLLKGFMLDISEDDLQGKQVHIMQNWNSYLNQPIVYTIELIFALLMLTGLIRTLLEAHQKKEPINELYLVPAFLFALAMLGTQFPILNIFSTFFRDYIPLFGEAFRFPFTKFVLVYASIYTVFFIKGLDYVLHYQLTPKPLYLRWLFLILLIIYSVPSFQGNFFYSVERLAIPQQYFDVIHYFQKEPADRRVMTLPQTSFWNWIYYKWGERGSGFMWYGIPQAQLERPFDPWSNYNEQYLNEVLYALQTNDAQLLKTVIEKYDISYVVLDENIQYISKLQQKDKLIDFIHEIYPDAEVTSFKNITVLKLTAKPYVAMKVHPTAIGSSASYTYYDQAYADYGDYYFDSNWDGFYLMPTLFTNKTQQDLEFDFSMQNNKVILTPQDTLTIPDTTAFYTLTGKLVSDSNLIPVAISRTSDSIRLTSLPLIISFSEKESYDISPIDNFIKLAPNKTLTSVAINGDLVNPDNNTLKYLYSDIGNTVRLVYTDGTSQAVSFNVSNKNDLKIDLRFNNSSYNQSLSFPIIHPDTWQQGNILEARTYQIESPCKEQPYSLISQYTEQDNRITLLAQDSATCFHQFLDNIEQNYGFYIYLNIDNASGMPLETVVDNPETKSNVVETQLNTTSPEKLLIIPPTNKFLYENYGFHLRNVSVNKNITTNTLNEMSVGYIPYKEIQSLKLIRRNNLTIAPTSVALRYEHPYFWLYKTQITNIVADNSVLYVSQSFHSDWKAYILNCSDNTMRCNIAHYAPFIFGTELRDHIKVNNWANGWKLTSSKVAPETTIMIVFLPQYLNFLGLGVLFIGILYFLLFRYK